jgi:hypothetical protein
MKRPVRLAQICSVPEMSCLMALDASGVLWVYPFKENPKKEWLIMQGPVVDVPETRRAAQETTEPAFDNPVRPEEML